MFRLIKKFITGLALVGLILQSSLVLGLFNPQKAHAQEPGDPHKVVINEFQVSPTADKFVEIYNANELGTADIDISDWFLSDFNHTIYKSDFVPEDTTLPAHGYYVFTSALLNQAEDEFVLSDSKSYTIGTPMTYGANPFTQIIAAPSTGKSAGQLNDGSNNWYVNLDPTPNLTNNVDESVLPARINSVHIPTSADNPEDIINSNNENAVQTEFTYEKLPSGDTTQIIFFTPSTVKAGTDVHTLPDGTIYLAGTTTRTTTRGAITSAITSEYLPVDSEGLAGQEITKDTIAPTEPTAAQVKKGTNNPANTINNFNKSSVVVDVNLPASSEATDIVTAELSDGINTESGTVLATDGSSTVTVEGIDATNLDDGTITVCAKTTNKAGNSSACTGTTALKDTVKPTGTIVINNYATVTNSVLAKLTLNSTSASEMMISTTSNFSAAKWLTYAKNTTWSLKPGNGLKKVYVKFKDVNGNVSAIVSDSINLNVEILNIVNNTITKGSNDPIFPISGLELDINANAATTLTSAIYASNPGDKMPTGINAFGKYFELAVENPEAISWPIMIKMYYTAADLAAAGITNEEQLLGIYFWDADSQSWKLYSQTGVETNNVIVNGIDYAGYVWANANHLTPLVIGCDVTAPTKPANFAAISGDTEISLSWSEITDAQGYFVRYREGTSIDNKPYITIYLSGAKSNTTKVTGLKNNTLYEFGIQAIDRVGNKSDWAIIIASPVLAGVATEEISGTRINFASSTTEPQSLQTEPQETEITTVGPEEGKVKSDTTTDWTRFWLTLLILVIALGAGFGGYYGYQWWMEGGKKVKVKTKSPPKQPEKGGRW